MVSIQNDDPNIAFLSSSLNNMLVCGILKGINICLTQINPNIRFERTRKFGKVEVLNAKFDTLEIIDPKVFANLDIETLKVALRNKQSKMERSFSLISAS